MGTLPTVRGRRRRLCSPCLCARAGGLGWGTALRRRSGCRWRRGSRLVPARPSGSLRSVLSRQPRLRKQRQRIEHHGQHHRRQQLLQHYSGQQKRHQRHLCKPAGAGCRDRHFIASLYHRPAGVQEFREGRSARSRQRFRNTLRTRCCALKRSRPRWQPQRSQPAAGRLRKPRRGRQDRASSTSAGIREAASGHQGKWWQTAGRLPGAPLTACHPASRGSGSQQCENCAAREAGDAHDSSKRAGRQARPTASQFCGPAGSTPKQCSSCSCPAAEQQQAGHAEQCEQRTRQPARQCAR